MPGRRGVRDIDTKLCRRCQQNEPNITVRNEPLCKVCFCRYVSTKVVKRMESFRVRHSTPDQERRLLLPLSFGNCSVALLHVLNEHLKGQSQKTGRTGFGLHIVHVKHATSPAEIDHDRILNQVQQRYQDHTYTTASLSDVFNYDGMDDLVELTGLRPVSADSSSNTEKLESLLGSLDSATARSDVKQILKRRLIVNIAKDIKCEAILWADSATKLAERTLAETAKGRGFSLSWIVADGDSPYGIPFYYPMRELMGKELMSFASLVDPPLDGLIMEEETKPAISTKNTTIDDLMRQYFESVEKEYPSVVANVVRTTGKLQAAPLSEVEKQCELCDMPLESQAPERSRLCYGCIRTLHLPAE